MPRPRFTFGISVSSPPRPELLSRGLSELHVRHVFIEMARPILASGWDVAYGGDIRRGGYTEALFDLVRTYNRRDLAGPERVSAYLHWPVWDEMTAKQRADLANVATLVRVDPATGIDASKAGAHDDLIAISRCVEAMRLRMEQEIDTRFVLGGQTSGQRGIIPGVVVEADLAIASGKPVYVAGGFGGAAGIVVAALRGEAPSALTAEYQRDHSPHYDRIDVRHDADFQLGAVVERLRVAGMAGLRNGLDEEENDRLAETDDADEVVALTLRGVHRLIGRTSERAHD